MIDRYHLRYFLAVVDEGNFSKAAQACNVSQPTLSVGISKLETSLGKLLFNRTNRRVELTSAGAHLLAYARRIEEGFAQAERDVAGTDVATTIRIGVLITTPPWWVERFVGAHRHARLSEQIEIIEGRERDLQERLVRGRIDLALTIIRDETARGEREILFSEGYSLAMSATHRLADRSAVAAEELVDEPMIVRRQCELLPETSRYFTTRRVRPFFAARTMSDDRAIGYVRAGLGVTVMPDSFVGPGIVMSHLEDFPFTRDVGLIYAPHVDKDQLRASQAIRLLIQTIDGARGKLAAP